MTDIAPAPRDRIRVTACAELESSPRAVVQLGTAPDNLPWLIEVDRSHRLQRLFDTVLQVFELARRDDLPERVRGALERDVASGLMGIHPAAVAGDGEATAYVSRTKLKRLLGPTLLSQILDAAPAAEPAAGKAAATNVGGFAARDPDAEMIEAVERSIQERRAKRHLVLRLGDGAAFTGAVKDTDRALRTPSPPFRPLAFESLASLGGVEAVLVSPWGEEWRTPLADWERFSGMLLRLHQNPQGGQVRFEVPRARLVDAIVAAARKIGELHRQELVHGDVAPGNLLVAGTGPTSFDSLDVRAGTPATAATFEWAAPEQIVGLPVDPRTDVYALGRIVTAIVGGVPFGEETTYVVPIGGDRSRRVKLLKGEGVFVDILDTELDRKWQMAWQEFLGSAVAYDAARRPRDAVAFADGLADLASRLPPAGTLDCRGQFGSAVPMETPDGWTFARLIRD